MVQRRSREGRCPAAGERSSPDCDRPVVRSDVPGVHRSIHQNAPRIRQPWMRACRVPWVLRLPSRRPAAAVARRMRPWASCMAAPGVLQGQTPCCGSCPALGRPGTAAVVRGLLPVVRIRWPCVAAPGGLAGKGDGPLVRLAACRLCCGGCIRLGCCGTRSDMLHGDGRHGCRLGCLLLKITKGKPALVCADAMCARNQPCTHIPLLGVGTVVSGAAEPDAVLRAALA